MAKLVLMVLSILVLGFAVLTTCKATTYVVGDSSGWDISTNLDTWVRDKKFIVGDVLSFQYTSTDSVCEVNKDSFQACNITNVIQCYSTGNTTIPLTYPGDRYFFCGNRLYCYSGMKLHVLVERNQSASTLDAAGPNATQPQVDGSGGLPPINPSSKSTPSIAGSSFFVHGGFDSIFLGFLGFFATLFLVV